MKRLVDKDQRNAATTGACKVLAPRLVPGIAYQAPVGYSTLRTRFAENNTMHRRTSARKLKNSA